jgi:hypothetical protein
MQLGLQAAVGVQNNREKEGTMSKTRQGFALNRVFLPLVWICLHLGLTACLAAAEEKKDGPIATAAIQVQGVQADQFGQNPDKPEMDESLREYQNPLRALGFGRYQALTGGVAKVAIGKPAEVGTGGYTVEIATAAIEKEISENKTPAFANASVTVKKGGKAIGKRQGYVLKQGEPVIIQVGTPKSPTLLVITLRGVTEE